MSQLSDAIQRLGLTGTAAEIVTALGATIQRTSTKQWSYQDICTDVRFGQAVGDALSAAISSTNGQAAVTQFVVKGIDLSLPQSQAGLDAIGQTVPSIAAQCAALKLLGVWQVPVWQDAELSSLPTESDASAALQQIADRSAFVTFLNECLNPAIAAGDLAALKSKVAAWGA